MNIVLVVFKQLQKRLLAVRKLLANSMSLIPKVIARDSGLDMRDMSTEMANRGVWEEISMNVLTTLVVKG